MFDCDRSLDRGMGNELLMLSRVEDNDSRWQRSFVAIDKAAKRGAPSRKTLSDEDFESGKVIYGDDLEQVAHHTIQYGANHDD